MKKEKKSFLAKAIKGKGKEKFTLEQLQKKLAEREKLKNEYLAGWQRARADLLNYKKEELKRIGELIKYANTPLVLKILSILDNFELAEKKIPEELKNNENIKGFLQIKNKLQDFLKNQGVERIITLGKKFDPNFQEAVEEIEKKGMEPGIVIEEVQKGYKLHDKIIRPTKVKISK